jgi:hypothetical protein
MYDEFTFTASSYVRPLEESNFNISPRRIGEFGDFSYGEQQDQVMA